MTDPRPHIPVLTVTGRTGVLVDCDDQHAWVQHAEGVVRYARGHVSYAAQTFRAGATYLNAAEFQDALRAARGIV